MRGGWAPARGQALWCLSIQSPLVNVPALAVRGLALLARNSFFRWDLRLVLLAGLSPAASRRGLNGKGQRPGWGAAGRGRRGSGRGRVLLHATNGPDTLGCLGREEKKQWMVKTSNGEAQVAAFNQVGLRCPPRLAGRRPAHFLLASIHIHTTRRIRRAHTTGTPTDFQA